MDQKLKKELSVKPISSLRDLHFSTGPTQCVTTTPSTFGNSQSSHAGDVIFRIFSPGNGTCLIQIVSAQSPSEQIGEVKIGSFSYSRYKIIWAGNQQPWLGTALHNSWDGVVGEKGGRGTKGNNNNRSSTVTTSLMLTIDSIDCAFEHKYANNRMCRFPSDAELL